MTITFTNEEEQMPMATLKSKKMKTPAFAVICSSPVSDDGLPHLHTFDTRAAAMDAIEHLSRFAVAAEQAHTPAQA